MPTPPIETTPVPVTPPRQGHGFLQTFGLDVRAAGLALIVDQMVFLTTWGSAGTLYAIEAAAGVILGFITYKIQKHWYGDSHDSALIKGLIVALLTAIPVPLTSIPVLGPAGILGLLHSIFAKRS